MKKYFPLFLFSFFYLNSIKAQDPIFSQNLNTRTYLNPAIAGTDSTLAISTGYRNQWAGTYATYHLSADQYVHFLRGGIGLDLIHDVAGQGTIYTTNINFNYAPHFELFNHKLSLQPGFSIGYFQKSIDYSKLNYGDQINTTTGFVYPTSEPSVNNTKSNVDFSAGIFMYTKKIYGGVAVKHINQPDEGFNSYSQLPYKLTLNAGANLSFNKNPNPKFIISPNLIYQKQQDFQELVFGVTTKYKWLILGIKYRNEDSMIFNIGFQNRFLKVGYTYDYTTSKLTNVVTSGSHEFQILWFMHYQKKPCKINTIRFI